jgi:hypothetical protein
MIFFPYNGFSIFVTEGLKPFRFNDFKTLADQKLTIFAIRFIDYHRLSSWLYILQKAWESVLTIIAKAGYALRLPCFISAWGSVLHRGRAVSPILKQHCI